MYLLFFQKTLSTPSINKNKIFYLNLSEGLNQGNLKQGEGSDSLKTTMETRGKTAWGYATIYLHYSK